jgi:sugar/nucleoside kinase (ribokinase family)
MTDQNDSPSNKPFDILVAGEINPDLILTGDVQPVFGQVEKLVDSASLSIGSSSAIFACGAARLGLKVAFVGVCGADLFGRFMLDEMTKRGVDVSAVRLDPLRPTGLSVILNRGSQGDRAILTHPGTIADLRADEVTDDLLAHSRHLHVASYFLQAALQPDLPGLFERAHTLGLTTSLDTNWDPSGQWIGVHELLPLTDVFLPNEKETIALTSARTAGQALKSLSQKTGTVALKRGAEGALACRGAETATARALCCDKVVDTIGAGDAFDAGFLYGFLGGWSLERTLWLAVVCGSLTTRAAGGTAAQPSLEEALQYVPSAG